MDKTILVLSVALAIGVVQAGWENPPPGFVMKSGQKPPPMAERLRQINPAKPGELRLVPTIDTAPGRLFFTAPKKEWTTVMTFEPDLSASLRKRAVIMENHRRDFLRLYKSKNL